MLAVKRSNIYDLLYNCVLTESEPSDDDTIPDPCDPPDQCTALIRVWLDVTTEALEWINLFTGGDSNAEYMFYLTLEAQTNLVITNSGIFNKKIIIQAWDYIDNLLNTHILMKINQILMEIWMNILLVLI